MTKKQKKVLIRIIIAAVLVIALQFIPVKGYVRFGLYMIPYFVIGYDILKKAGKGILNRQIFDENFLMAVATIGAIALGDYKEGTAVMLFYQIGELFQSYAVGKSRRNISDLMDIRPDYANVEKDGELEQVDPDEIEIGTVIVVQPGEKVPIDGVVVEGTSSLNTSALTGESVPREVSVDDEIISGCINMTGLLKIRTTKEFGESTEDFGTGRECKLQKITFRELYLEVCEDLYTGSLLWCSGTCHLTADRADGIYGACTGMGRLGIPCPDIPCNQLSMCTGNQYSA